MRITELILRIKPDLNEIKISDNRNEVLQQLYSLKEQVKQLLENIGNLPPTNQLRLESMKEIVKLPEFKINLYDPAFAYSVIHSPVKLEVNELPKVCLPSIICQPSIQNLQLPSVIYVGDATLPGVPTEPQPPSDTIPPDIDNTTPNKLVDVNTGKPVNTTAGNIRQVNTESNTVHLVVATPQGETETVSEGAKEFLNNSDYYVMVDTETAKNLGLHIPDNTANVVIATKLTDAIKNSIHIPDLIVNTAEKNFETAKEKGAITWYYDYGSGKIYYLDKDGNIVYEANVKEPELDAYVGYYDKDGNLIKTDKTKISPSKLMNIVKTGREFIKSKIKSKAGYIDVRFVVRILSLLGITEAFALGAVVAAWLNNFGDKIEIRHAYQDLIEQLENGDYWAIINLLWITGFYIVCKDYQLAKIMWKSLNIPLIDKKLEDWSIMVAFEPYVIASDTVKNLILTAYKLGLLGAVGNFISYEQLESILNFLEDLTVWRPLVVFDFPLLIISNSKEDVWEVVKSDIEGQ